MLATIERIERKQGQNGSYHLVHLDEGKKLYCWDSRLAQSLQVGAVYEVEVREGRFPRLLSARQVTTLNGGQDQALKENASKPPVRASRAAKLEALYLCKEALGPQRGAKELIEAASALLLWLQEGEEGGEGR